MPPSSSVVDWADSYNKDINFANVGDLYDISINMIINIFI